MLKYFMLKLLTIMVLLVMQIIPNMLVTTDGNIDLYRWEIDDPISSIEDIEASIFCRESGFVIKPSVYGACSDYFII